MEKIENKRNLKIDDVIKGTSKEAKFRMALKDANKAIEQDRIKASSSADSLEKRIFLKKYM